MIMSPVRAALIPLLEAAGPRIDAARELPLDVVQAMHANQMFRLLLPRSVGGVELDPATYVQAVEAIAMGDGSTAWCMNQGSGCSMSAAYLPPEAARAVFGRPDDVLAWGQARGRAHATKVPGGWRVTGTWLFASGSRHSTWLGGHVPDALPDGTPVERSMLFPRTEAKIEDVWQVLGLRGTGSDTYSVEDLFVPDDYSIVRGPGSVLPRIRHAVPLHHAQHVCLWLRCSRAGCSARHAGRLHPRGVREEAALRRGDARQQRDPGADRTVRCAAEGGACTAAGCTVANIRCRRRSSDDAR